MSSPTILPPLVPLAPADPLDQPGELDSVPHLTTALRGPLAAMESLFLEHQSHIEAWLRKQWREFTPPFYASVDLRNAGFKVAPVDTNLFPAGFNNIHPTLIPLAILAIQTALGRVCPNAIGIAIVPESHTRNLYYMESVATLQEILLKAGYEVRVGALPDEWPEPVTFDLPSGRSLHVERLRRDEDRVYVGDFSPCAILLNNDLMGGRPPILEGLEQDVVPPLDLGWARRRKSEHFALYREVCREFAEVVGIDPWLIDPLFRNCGEVNFKTRDGEECLATNVDALLTGIREKYAQYGITLRPFVVVKADSGSYGMGIMMVRSGQEIYELNRKQRTRMAATKGGRDVQRVILQEGVFSFETWGEDQAVTEPVVYMIDRFVVGGFYRVHTQRGPDENLNAPGMHFQPLAFHESCNNPDPARHPDAEPNRFYLYGVIARLALLAAAREIKRQSP
jgi:glutamate--cysteine ligase